MEIHTAHQSQLTNPLPTPPLCFLLGWLYRPDTSTAVECCVCLVAKSCSTLCYPKDCRLGHRQAPLSLGFSRQEYWSGLSFPAPECLLDPGIRRAAPNVFPYISGRFFTTELPGKLCMNKLYLLSLNKQDKLQSAPQIWPTDNSKIIWMHMVLCLSVALTKETILSLVCLTQRGKERIQLWKKPIFS